MTHADRLAAEDVIRRYLESLDHAALTRIVEAEQWTQSAFRMPGGACCLVGHGDGLAGLTSGAVVEWMDRRSRLSFDASAAFTGLCETQGIARTVAAIQLLAATLLHDRETAALRALLGEENHSHV